MTALVADSVVRVWTVRQEAPDVQARLRDYGTLLTADERQRAGRLLQQGDRDRFVIGRALARTMLSHCAEGVRPRDWPFAIDAHGWPHLASRPPGAPDLRFNLSHTPGLVACVVAISREVGVDVEFIGRRMVHGDIPERFFSPREVADLRARPEDEQHDRFFDYWTLKESYIKARGLGLALPLGQFSFTWDAGQAPTIAFGPELPDDASSWQFGQFWPTREHRMAVAVRRTGSDLPIAVSDVVPEVSE